MKAVRISELKARAPDLFGIPTGTGIDRLFYTVEWKDGKPVRKVLGGLPYRAVMNVVGIPDTGKSVLAEQFAVYQAGRDYSVMFVTTESPAYFLYNSMRQKAVALGLRWEDVEKKIAVLDVSNSDLREELGSFLKTLGEGIDEFRTSITVIDSITGLYEHKEVAARQIVRKVYNLLKEKGQTAMLVSQKRSSQAMDTAEAAGGLAVAHIVDGTMVMEKVVVSKKWEAEMYGVGIGKVARLFRIDGCRITGHDDFTWMFEITPEGLFKLTKRLGGDGNGGGGEED